MVQTVGSRGDEIKWRGTFDLFIKLKIKKIMGEIEELGDLQSYKVL